MCDCNNSLSLVCLCRQNLLRYVDGQPITANPPPFQNYPLSIPAGTVFRENYTVAGEASQVRRCSMDSWDAYLGALPVARETQFFRDGVYDVVCDGPRVYLFGIHKQLGGTRLVVINAATSLVETDQKIFASDYAQPSQGFDGSLNAGRISVGPYGVDFFPPGGAKIRIPRSGENWGAPQIVSPFIQLTDVIPANDPIRSVPGWLVYRTEVRYNQPKYNRGGVAIAGGIVAIREAATGFSNVRTLLRVKVGTLNSAGRFVASQTVWNEEFPTPVYAPQVTCASMNGTIFWSACSNRDQFGVGVLQAKGLTPFGSYTFGGLVNGVPVGVAYFHEVYPDGVAVAWQYGNGAYKYGFSDGGANHWQVDSTALQRINSDANGVWVTDAGVTGGRMRRYRKDGASYETIALPDLAAWGDPFKDGLGIPAGFGLGRQGVDEAHHGSTIYETFKLDDCFSGGPPSALLG